MGIRQVFAVLTVVWATTTVSARAGEDPQGFLERMGTALEDLNYEGTLVQLQGTDAAVMRVVHRVENGVATERITAMDEVGREIIRRGEEVICILPDQQAVIVETTATGAGGTNPLRQQFGRGVRFDDRYYRLGVSSGGKLVGRDTHVVTVRPTDSYRYGYRVWLDAASGMPLKVQIATEEGAVIEQLLFTDISLPAHIPATAIKPSAMIDSFSWRRSPAEADPRITKVAEPMNWRANSLPPGFSLQTVHAGRRDASDELLTHMVYSDGVASISVFIESGVGAAEQGEGPSQLGGANAYTTVLGGHLITAFGEVPVRTVEAIARSIQPVVAPAK